MKLNCNYCKHAKAYENPTDPRFKFYCPVINEDLNIYRLTKERDCIEFEPRGEVTIRRETSTDKPARKPRCVKCGGEVSGDVIHACYCDECRKTELALDKAKFDVGLDNANMVHELATAVVTQAVKDYKTALYGIKDNPMRESNWLEKEELEEFFASKEFTLYLAVLINYEKDKTDFEAEALHLIWKLRRECRFDPSRYIKHRTRKRHNTRK